jgi:hypothetical protein
MDALLESLRFEDVILVKTRIDLIQDLKMDAGVRQHDDSG